MDDGTPLQTAFGGFRVSINTILAASSQIFFLQTQFFGEVSPFLLIYLSANSRESNQSHLQDRKEFKTVPVAHHCLTSFIVDLLLWAEQKSELWTDCDINAAQ